MSNGKPRIGFIGLGLMGTAFTRRLVECGFEVAGFDIDQSRIESVAKNGVRPADSPSALTEATDIVMLCVTSTDSVETAVFGENGVCVSAKSDKVLIDFSTTIVATTREMAERLRGSSGMGWVDAPVSGGPEAATAGTLAIMAGGSDDDIVRVTPVMEHLAAGFTHFGPTGAGQIAKMVNQVLVLNNYVVIAEALALAEAGGIDAAKIPDALAAGHAGSNLLKSNFPRMIARDYAPRGYSRQVLKDLDMVRDLSRELDLPAPMTERATELYRMHNNDGGAELDGVSIFEVLSARRDETD